MSKSNTLLAVLGSMAGVDKNGNSKASTAVEARAASLYAALYTEQDANLKQATDDVAIAKAERSLRVADQTREARVAARKADRLAGAESINSLSASELQTLQEAAKRLRAPKAEKEQATEQMTALKRNDKRNGKSKVATMLEGQEVLPA